MAENGTALQEPEGVVASGGLVRAKSGKYLTFKLGMEEYGIEILKVREIIGLMEITPVPRTPHFVKGVINLRGKVIPVIDLRVKFHMEPTRSTEETCIIVVEVEQGDEGEIKLMGTLVDTVSEVMDIIQSQIEPSPEFGDSMTTEHILGMGKIDKLVIMLLDIDRILSGFDWDDVEYNRAVAENKSLNHPVEEKPDSSDLEVSPEN